MLVLHGFWSRVRGLCLWAEDSDAPVTSPSQALRRARPHPFAVPADDLADVLAEAGRGKAATASMLLPSLRRSPLDSPELVRVQPRRERAPRTALLPWQVPVVAFEPAAAASVLEHRIPAVRHGAAVQHLAAVAGLARDLVDRGRVLPGVERSGSGTGHAGRWRPVLQGPDVATLRALVAAMPPVCRAEVAAGDGPEGSREHSPGDLVGVALHALVDAEVRARGGQSLLPRRRGRRPARVPVVETWLDSLTAADGAFDAAAEDVAVLERALLPWSEVGTGRQGPARVSFRLVEPAGEDAGNDTEDDTGEPEHGDGERHRRGWRLEFWLQSVEDPSLLVPAEQVWAGGDGLARWMRRPDELLLAELGRAVALYPALAEALRRPRPAALDLDAEGTYEFLATVAPVLDQAGFGVLLPSWWSGRRALGLHGSASTPREVAVTGGRFSREALVDFQWRLAIGDDPLTEEELEALAASKAPLVRLRGQWVAIDAELLRRGLDFIRARPAGPRTAGEVIALATRHPDDVDTPLPVTSVHADGTLGELLRGSAERALSPVPVPAGLRAELRPYQLRGLSWLAFLSELGLGACLADDMGLGKTVQLLALEAHRRGQHPGAAPTLLVCPVSLVGNWQREAARFAPALRTHVHHGPGRPHGADLEQRLEGVDIVVTTYQTVTRDVDELATYLWDRVVLDEAQAVKNSLSQAAKAVRRLRAGHRVALTGTPMENRLAELWAVMDFLNPGMLGTAETFRARYAVPVERHGQTEPAARLRAVTRPYLLRRLKTDPTIIDDLPEKIEIKQHCRLTAEQAALYQSVVEEMMRRIETSTGIERRGNVLAAMTKLKQVCNHPAQLLHDRSPVARRSGKVLRLEEITEEILAEGDKALLFTQYTEFAELLLPHLSARFDTDVLYLNGQTPKSRRDEMVARFQSDGGPSLFLLSLKAGGTGLNLTAANHVVHLDRWWNPAVENQATDRAFRIGQRRSVQVRKFVCVGTLEERIDEMIEDKKALADAVVSDGERWLTELSTDALRDLFTLSQDAADD